MIARHIRVLSGCRTMSSLTHALLTEDEAVLLEALEPSPDDRVLALFARGNGDAGLSLLQAGPSTVFMLDLLDQEALVAQFQLKQWLFHRLDNPSLRAFLGIADGFEPDRRDSLLSAAMHELSPLCRAFWRPRRACVRNGMARSDGTAAWCRTLNRLLRVYRMLPAPLRAASARSGRCLAPFYFPREERRYSLGYRQLMAQPEQVLDTFVGRLGAKSVLNLIPYADFQYLSPQGHDAVRRNLDRVGMLNGLPPPVPCNKFYFSNVIDYLSVDEFYALLRVAVPTGRKAWRAFLNSSLASSDVHPYLRRGIQEGLFRFDVDRTSRLRAIDRVGAYPGLTVIRSNPEMHGKS